MESEREQFESEVEFSVKLETELSSIPSPHDHHDNDNNLLQRKMISKDQLSSAICCRLCAQGAEVNEQETPVESEFISLFDNQIKTQPDAELPIHRLINKYLPIEVLESDSHYPKVICRECSICLHKTIEFFKKICEGQRLLANIFNVKSVVPDNSPEPSFSDDNPLHKAAKRRGRPRKRPVEEKSSLSSEKNTVEALAPEFTERRTKRQSRPPVRYADEAISSTVRNGEDLEETADPASRSEFSPPSTRTLTCNTQINTRESDETYNHPFSTDFSINQHQLMDLGKFDVLINENATCTVPKIGTDKSTATAGLLTSESNDAVVLGDTKNINNSETVQQKQELDDEETPYDDDKKDKTVRLRDLYRRPKRKQKKRANAKNAPKIQCDQCPKMFNHASSLGYHRLSVHEKIKNFACNVCGRKFAHKQLLNNHKYVHTDDKYFNCDLCQAKFKSRASLYTHKKSRHSAVKEHSCGVCGSQFSLKSSLVGHMRLHTGEKPFHCEFCEKKFAQRSNLREHRRTHTGEKPYHCTECSKSFTTASQLRSHKFCHSSDKIHLCQICGKGFNHADTFKYHMRRHNSDKPVQCPICPKKFTEGWTFKKHMRLHTGEKPYQCVACNKEFSDPSNFAKHKRTHIVEQKIEVAEAEQSIEEYLLPDPIKGEVETLMQAEISSNNDIPVDNAVMEETSNYITADETSSVVQILDTENLSYRTLPQEEEVEQVIYVYSRGPLFTFAMTDESHQHSHEMSVEDESTGNLDSGGLESFNPNDIESHYYSLENVGDSTIAVPIQLPLSQPGTHNSGNTSRSQ